MYAEVATNIGTPAEVIDRIGAFAQSAGWTIVANTLAGSNRTLILRKSGSFVQFANTNTTDLTVRASNQQGADFAPFTATANLGAGPYAKLYLFADEVPTEHVHVVFELSAGLVRLASFGEVEKTGAWAGGTFFDTTYWSASATSRGNWMSSSHALFSRDRGTACGGVRVDAESLKWANFNNSSSGSFLHCDTGISANGQSAGYLKTHVDLDLNAHNQRRIGRPIKLAVLRAGGNYSPIGFLPGIRFIRIDTFNFGQERPDPDGTMWKIFPLVRKGLPPNPNNSTLDYSDLYGYAIRKVA